ncbi:MAG: hypothetical protein R3C53_10915 [Pirellulaceae bacterium]
MKSLADLTLALRLIVLGIFLAGCCGCEMPADNPPAATPPESDTVAQKAQAGVGKQGQIVQDHSDAQKIISGPVNTLFQFKQKAVFDIQIPQALNLYKATNGNFPKSHDEFMTHIIEANRIQLPELPEGAVYRFNVELGELWVYPVTEVPQ